MAPQERYKPHKRRNSIKYVFLTLKVALLIAWGALAQGAEPSSATEELQRRLDAQAEEIRELRMRVERQEAMFEGDSATAPDCDASASLQRLPIVAEVPISMDCTGDASKSKAPVLHYYADYDRGFLIRPFDSAKHPFELKTNGWIQFRHHAFARDVVSWTDNAGVTRLVENRNAFDIERARLVFSGFAQDKRLTYFLQLDGDTDGGHAVDFFDYWWAWRFSDRFQIQLGKRKVPGSRQWLLGARDTRLIDRPVATDFFRPDRTVGVFGVGRIGAHGRYQLMVGNGYRTTNLPNSATDHRLTFAATHYVDPLGDFGAGIVDAQVSCEPRVRLGHSFIYSPQTGAGATNMEADFLRLSDGTRLTQTGALAPNITVSEFDLFFYSVDFAMKWRGWSCNAEAYFRWIEQIQGNGPLPLTDLYQHGYYVEGGRFLVPERLDVNVRYSQVSGLFGDFSEYAAGVNWYPCGSKTVKISFDVTSLDGSPLQNTATDILVGDDGLLFRSQFQAQF